MGPLALLDLIGLDTMLSVGEVLYAEFRDERYAPPPLLRRMVAAGRPGPQVRRRLLRRVKAASDRRSTRWATDPSSQVSSWCFFQAASSALRWKRGKTQRKTLRPGFWHQQSGSQPHMLIPTASFARPTKARIT